jgi:hypothetical protein
VNRTALAFLLGGVASGWWLASARAADDPLALTAREPDPTWEMDTSLSGRSYSLQYPQVQTGGFQEGAGLTFTQFLAPLRDDGSPYTLRSFLERTGSLSMSVGVGHLSTHNPFQDSTRTATWGDVSGGLNIYVKRWLAVTAGLDYDYDSIHDTGFDDGAHFVSGFAGLGFRAGDVRLDVSYDASASRQFGAWTPIRRELDISAFGVFARRRLALGIGAEVVRGGFGGSASAEYFPSPDLGLFVDGTAVRGKLYVDADFPVNRYTVTGGISGWVDGSTGMVARYTRMIEDQPSQGAGGVNDGERQTSHQVTLNVLVLFP